MATPRRIKRNEHFDALNKINRLFLGQFRNARSENNEEFDTSTTVRWRIPAAGGFYYAIQVIATKNGLLVEGMICEDNVAPNWNFAQRQQIDTRRMGSDQIIQEGTDGAMRIFRKLRGAANRDRHDPPSQKLALAA